MRETQISLPELIMIAGTRVALGAGIGLLLADRLSEEQRRAVGWTLVAVGAISTIPLAAEVLGGGRLSDSRPGDPFSSSAPQESFEMVEEIMAGA